MIFVERQGAKKTAGRGVHLYARIAVFLQQQSLCQKAFGKVEVAGVEPEYFKFYILIIR